MKNSPLLFAVLFLAPTVVRADDPPSPSAALSQLQSPGADLTQNGVTPDPQDPKAPKPQTPPAPDAQEQTGTFYVGKGGTYMYQPHPDGSIPEADTDKDGHPDCKPAPGNEQEQQQESEQYCYGDLLEGEQVQVEGGPAPTDPNYSKLQDYVKVRVNRTEAGGAPTEAWVKKSSLQKTSEGLTPPPAYDPSLQSVCRQKFIEALKTFQGVPYKWGGTTKNGVDCSGLMVAAMLQAHCSPQSPPRTAAAQQQAAQKLGNSPNGQGLPPGSQIFEGTPAHHTWDYLGNGQIIEAAHTGTNVTIKPYRSGSGGNGDVLKTLGVQ